MGQQQLLLIILGTIIVGLAIAVGLSMFTAQSVESNKDAIIHDLNNLAAEAHQYRIRPTSMDGGARSYEGFTISSNMESNDNATYTCSTTEDEVTFTAVSTQDPANTIVAEIGTNGKFVQSAWSYTGEFL